MVQSWTVEGRSKAHAFGHCRDDESFYHQDRGQLAPRMTLKDAARHIPVRYSSDKSADLGEDFMFGTSQGHAILVV